MLPKNSEPVDWVKRRTICDNKGVFDTIASQVKSDYDKFKPWAEENRKGLTYRFTRNTNFASVGRENGDSNSQKIEFHLKEKEGEIIITGDDVHHVVTSNWDHETATCQLFLDGKKLEAWQISQAALYSLFFE